MYHLTHQTDRHKKARTLNRLLKVAYQANHSKIKNNTKLLLAPYATIDLKGGKTLSVTNVTTNSNR